MIDRSVHGMDDQSTPIVANDTPIPGNGRGAFITLRMGAGVGYGTQTHEKEVLSI